MHDATQKEPKHGTLPVRDSHSRVVRRIGRDELGPVDVGYGAPEPEELGLENGKLADTPLGADALELGRALVRADADRVHDIDRQR